MIPMTHDALVALAAFAFVSSITPGPNNLMLLASGVNFGFRRSLPHMCGVALGFVFMVVMVGLGVMGLFDLWPLSLVLLKAAGVVYMLWLAWKVANAAPPGEGGAAGRPFTFLQAAGFQWVNPKAWAMALTAVTVYAPGREFQAVLWVALVFGAVNLPSVGSWTVLGQGMRRVLRRPAWLRAFNWSMAGLLLASLAVMV